MRHQQTCLVQPSDSQNSPVISRFHFTPELKEPHDVLVRVSVVALNPTDYKMPQFHPTPHSIMGCDFMGWVVERGPAVADVRVGTRICGVVHGSNPANPGNGAFAEYLVTDSRLVLRLPDHWSDLEGAALGGTGWITMGLSITDLLGLAGLPSKPASLRKDGSREPVLVYGGATASGTMACQLLSIAGYDPIATVSNASADMVKSYGAVKTFPYSSSTCGDAIKKETKGTMRHAIDCITTPESVQCCLKALGRAGGRCVTLEYADDELKTRKAVKFDMIMAYIAFGKGVELPAPYHREPDMDKLYSASRWRDDVQQLVDQRRIRCHPIQEVSGGWEGIIKGLEMIKDGQVRGKKLVVRVG
ncbi:alcohol dehydrogenase GroES-like domain-containing protein [Thelonectria olida]|uniref:Alcohol dehydrogenase GroES-like domain-containing protein n=1 Tax=Thelonectria olida TaxID=1576542 RepID=A0A9P8VUU6_9HYPO|nr:alcohol dehydrogenase GroES-like domain-containing protein [Thelonectria olida]